MRLPLPSKLLLSDIEIIKKQIFYPCPFELPAKQHRPVSPSWPNGRCCLAGNSKGHRRISKIFLSLFLYTWVDQNIFFPEIYNAPIISELGFTVCYEGHLLVQSYWQRQKWRTSLNGDSHRESELRNDRGIIYFWKKYILVYSCIQKQGKKKNDCQDGLAGSV